MEDHESFLQTIKFNTSFIRFSRYQSRFGYKGEKGEYRPDYFCSLLRYVIKSYAIRKNESK